MELKYTHINKLSNKATMYLVGVIGQDVDGLEFAKELRYLENTGIEDVDIRINSVGGSVIDGYDIVDAVLESPLNVNTTIYGMAASMAGVIAMAGKKVRITENGIFMIHSVSGPRDAAVVDKFNASLIAIFAGRTNVKRSYLNKLMKGETYFTAQESLAAGFVDEVLPTKSKVEVSNLSLEEIVNVYNKIKIEDMQDENQIDNNEEINVNIENVEEVVNEVEETVEAVVEGEEANIEESIAVINEESEVVEEVVNEVVEEVVVNEEEQPEEKSELQKQLEELITINEQLTKELAELKQAENKRLADEKEAQEMAVINSAIEAGKIKEDVKSTWINFIKIDFDGAKKALDNIVVNKAAVDIMKIVNKGEAAKPSMGLREMEKNNPRELERIYNETPEIYNQMYFDQYGVYPN